MTAGLRTDDRRQNDLITWLIETSTQDYHRDPRDLALRILAINFAAIHTSTMVCASPIRYLTISEI